LRFYCRLGRLGRGDAEWDWVGARHIIEITDFCWMVIIISNWNWSACWINSEDSPNQWNVNAELKTQSLPNEYAISCILQIRGGKQKIESTSAKQ
jgi:hypothetical protein